MVVEAHVVDVVVALARTNLVAVDHCIAGQQMIREGEEQNLEVEGEDRCHSKVESILEEILKED